MRMFERIMARRRYRILRVIDMILGILLASAFLLYDFIYDNTTLMRILAGTLTILLAILEKFITFRIEVYLRKR